MMNPMAVVIPVGIALGIAYYVACMRAFRREMVKLQAELDEMHDKFREDIRQIFKLPPTE